MENENERNSQEELENTSNAGTGRPHRQRIPYGERVVRRPHNFENRNGYRRPYGRSEYSYRPQYGDNPYRSQYNEPDNAPVEEGQAPYENRYRSRQDGGMQRGRNYGRGEQRFYGRGNGGGYRQQGRFQRPGYQRQGYWRNQAPGANGQDGYDRPMSHRHNGYGTNAGQVEQKVLRYKEENFDPNEPIRLNRFLANAGVCSRREADLHITNGKVTVNGEVVTEMGHKVLRTDSVCFNGKPVSLEDKVYVLLNKPKDYVTTADDPEGRKTVMDLVKDACPERIYPVGRLDRNTTGVLLLTNDGEMAAKMMHPKFAKKKIYHVFCNKPVSFASMQKILKGIMLEDGEVHADRIEYVSEADRKQIGIEIHSGKNRVVRRIFENLGYKVVKLDRVYFAGLTKKNLRRGHWRFLEEAEVNMLRMGAYE